MIVTQVEGVLYPPAAQELVPITAIDQVCQLHAHQVSAYFVNKNLYCIHIVVMFYVGIDTILLYMRLIASTSKEVQYLSCEFDNTIKNHVVTSVTLIAHFKIIFRFKQPRILQYLKLS